MEIFFTSVFARFEAILVMIFVVIAAIILLTYLYQYIERIIRVFGPNKRDAKLQSRDFDILKKREQAESMHEEEKELPPPITLEEIEEKAEEKTEEQEEVKHEEIEETEEIEKNNEGKAKISAFIIIILAIAGIYTLLALILDIIVVLLK